MNIGSYNDQDFAAKTLRRALTICINRLYRYEYEKEQKNTMALCQYNMGNSSIYIKYLLYKHEYSFCFNRFMIQNCPFSQIGCSF